MEEQCIQRINQEDSTLQHNVKTAGMGTFAKAEPAHSQRASQHVQDKRENEEKDTTPSEQSPSTRAHKYTNVTFPRGFSPSQCFLLASRQRSANYLFFSSSERGEFMSNQTASCQSDESIQKRKKSKKVSLNPVIQSCQQENRCLKPDLPVLAGKEKSFRTMVRIDTQTGSTGSRYRLRTGQTGITTQARWRSKEEIARNLAEHVQKMLKIQSNETIAEIQRVERTLHFKQSRTDSFSPKLPVYLFDQNRALNSVHSAHK